MEIWVATQVYDGEYNPIGVFRTRRAAQAACQAHEDDVFEDEAVALVWERLDHWNVEAYGAEDAGGDQYTVLLEVLA